MTHVSTRTLDNGLRITIVEDSAYGIVTATDARRFLAKEAMHPEYASKSLVDIKSNKDIVSRYVTKHFEEYHVLDVAEMWAVFNPDQFGQAYKFRRVLMSDDQRNFMKCENLHAYPSLEFRQCEKGEGFGSTFKPMLSPKDMLQFFNSSFFNTNSCQPVEKGAPYKLCLFEEDINTEQPGGPACSSSRSSLAHSWPKQVTASMNALCTTRQLMEDVRTVKNEEVSHQVKRRRFEMIKAKAVENLLGGIVEANIEMYELLLQEQKE